MQGITCNDANKVPRTPAGHMAVAPEIQAAVALIFTSAPLSPPTVLLGGWKDYVSSRLQASVARKLRLFFWPLLTIPTVLVTGVSCLGESQRGF